jgi:hypothetical protein
VQRRKLAALHDDSLDSKSHQFGFRDHFPAVYHPVADRVDFADGLENPDFRVRDRRQNQLDALGTVADRNGTLGRGLFPPARR